MRSRYSVRLYSWQRSDMSVDGEEMIQTHEGKERSKHDSGIRSFRETLSSYVNSNGYAIGDEERNNWHIFCFEYSPIEEWVLVCEGKKCSTGENAL